MVRRFAGGLLVLAVSVLAFFGTFAPAWAGPADGDAQLQTVRVGYYESRNFTEGAKNGVSKSGYGYEYLQRAAGYAGWRIEYVYGTWDELYDQLRQGTIDMLPGVSATAEHREQVSFPESSMLSETFYLYGKDSSVATDRDDASSYAGKRIGVVAGSNASNVFERWRAAEGIEPEVVTYPSFSVMHKAFKRGQLDALVSSDNVAYAADDIAPAVILGTEPYYLAVAPGKTELLDKLNQVLAIMNSQDRIFLDELQNRYAADSSVRVYLSSDEEAWLAEHRTLTVGYLDEYLPYCDKTEDGDATGLMVDVITALLDGLPKGREPDLKVLAFTSQKDLLAALKAGKVDVAFPVSANASFAEQNGYLASSAVVSPTMDLVLKTGSDVQKSIKRVAVNRNNLMQRAYVENELGAGKLIKCDSIDECLDAVKEGRADSTVVNGLRVGALLRSEKNLYQVQLPEEDARCFAVASGNGVLLRLLNRGLGMLGEDYGTNASSRYLAGLYRYTVVDLINDHLPWVIVGSVTVVVMIAAAGVHHARKLRRENEHEAEQNQRLEDALARAERASRAKDVMLTNLSHDIRTPLNGILGVMDVNSSCDDPDLVRENTKRARTAARQLLGLVDDLLELTQLRSGDVEVDHEAFSLSAVLDGVLKEFAPQAEEAGVDLRHRSHSAALDTVWVYGSPTYVRQVFANVLDNAVRYNRRGGHVVWECGLTGDGPENAVLTCSIEDDGVGMSQEFLGRVFEPFQQERVDARSVYPGSGLGLPIVQALLELMGGTIDISSELGEGTTAVVSIPFALAEGPEPVTVTPASFDGLAGMRVLLAEDNELNLDITRYVLEHAGAARVVCVRDGAEAVRAFEDAPVGSIDVVLMDIMMPVMNGYEAARAIRALDRADAAAVPIIALTAKAFAEDRHEAFDAGMNEHLSKPIDSELLVSTLTKYRS